MPESRRTDRAMPARKRVQVALLLAVQLLGTLVPLADAWAGDSDGGPVHIEARSDRSCDPIHLHDDCALCQHIGSCLAAWAGSDAEGPLAVSPLLAPTVASTVPALLSHPPRGRSPPTV
jgi:hypothetical protein